MNELNAVLTEQQLYYNDRASEYDDWWYRRGAFDEGAEANAKWNSEAAIVQKALDDASLEGDVLELAAGTGTWSRQLLQKARTLTIVDGSPQMLERNPVTSDPKVTALQADIFQWRAERSFDAVAFGFWISHVPREMLPSFLESVARHLRIGGKFFFVDNLGKPEASAPHVLGKSGQLMKRRLANGQVSTIVKNYFSREELIAHCLPVGLEVEVFETPELFQYGVGHRVT